MAGFRGGFYCIFFLLSFWPGLSLAKSTGLIELKAAFLYRFSSFFRQTGPNPKSSSTTNFCFVNAPLLLESARRSYGPLENVLIHDLKAPDEIKDCDIAYLDPSGKYEIQPFLDIAKEQDILTVDETEEFLEQGGILRFFTNSKSQLRFELNLEQAKKSGIQFKAQFLRVAKIKDR